MGATKPRTGFEIERLPAEMTSARRWVNWKAVERDGKWTKIPVNPENGSNASSTDPSTWGSFSDAAMAATEDIALGIGFVLGDGWLGVDFDGLDGHEELRTWATRWSIHCGTYVEWSPSLNGYHAIFRGVSLPDWSANRRGPVEVYQSGRYFTVTGNSLYEDREIGSDQTAVDLVCDAYLRRDTKSGSPASRRTAQEPFPSTGDASADDYAYACDLARKGLRQGEMEDLLRSRMELMGRDEKAARRDYVPRTVAAAIEEVGAPAEPEKVTGTALAALLTEHTVKTPYVINRLLRRGEVAAVIAPPKCRKSFLIADLALSAAIGGHWAGQWAVSQSRVLLVDNELSANEIADRTRSIMGSKGISVGDVGDRLEIVTLRDSDAGIDQVARDILAMDPAPQLIIFDALYMFLEKGMDENSNADMTVLLRKFRRLAARTQAAVVLVHHTSKGAQNAKDPIDLGAGAGALGRAVDTNVAIFRHSEDDCFVMRFNVRSSKPVGDLGIRWDYPTFSPALGLDLEDLHVPGRKKAE